MAEIAVMEIWLLYAPQVCIESRGTWNVEDYGGDELYSIIVCRSEGWPSVRYKQVPRN